MVILFDRFNLPEDVFEVVFATKQQIIVVELKDAEQISQAKAHFPQP